MEERDTRGKTNNNILPWMKKVRWKDMENDEQSKETRWMLIATRKFVEKLTFNYSSWVTKSKLAT